MLIIYVIYIHIDFVSSQQNTKFCGVLDLPKIIHCDMFTVSNYIKVYFTLPIISSLLLMFIYHSLYFQHHYKQQQHLCCSYIFIHYLIICITLHLYLCALMLSYQVYVYIYRLYIQKECVFVHVDIMHFNRTLPCLRCDWHFFKLKYGLCPYM